MSTISERRKLIVVVAVAAAAVVIVASGAAAIGWLAGRDVETVVSQEPADDDAAGQEDDGGGDDAAQDGDDERQSGEDEASEDEMNEGLSSAGSNVLPEPMGGQEAIDELGENLEAVAKKNGMTADKLRDLLARDSTVKVTPGGFVLFIDTATPHPTE